MKLIIDISEYNREWINNAYRIPQEIDPDITRAIIDGEPIEPERKTGKWIELDSEEDRYDEIMCPHCRRVFTVDAYHWTDIGFTKSDLKFCPNCGAKMEE